MRAFPGQGATWTTCSSEVGTAAGGRAQLFLSNMGGGRGAGALCPATETLLRLSPAPCLLLRSHLHATVGWGVLEGGPLVVVGYHCLLVGACSISMPASIMQAALGARALVFWSAAVDMSCRLVSGDSAGKEGRTAAC
jgi:hypothetical protein